MKYTICILLYSTLFLVNSVHSLSGGTAVVAGVFPSHALVLVGTTPFGGTIINANHVLTACGIVLNNQHELLPVAQFNVRVGIIALNGGTNVAVSAVFPHPEYNPWTRNHDVAVLRTATSFVFNVVPNPPVAPAILNNRIIADATSCNVVGFNNAPADAPLQTLAQSILNRDTGCNTAAAHNGRVLETMICAATAVANTGICASTRGGGIYCNGQLTGIASQGLGCGEINSPAGVYTQVRHHIQWINEQLTRTQIPAAGPTPIPGFPATGSSTSVIASSLLVFMAFLLSKL